MHGVGQEERRPCHFSDLFACDRGTTPRDLLQRGIYSEIAVPLRGGAWRQTSMVMLAQAIAQGAAKASDEGEGGGHGQTPADSNTPTTPCKRTTWVGQLCKITAR